MCQLVSNFILQFPTLFSSFQLYSFCTQQLYLFCTTTPQSLILLNCAADRHPNLDVRQCDKPITVEESL